MRATPYPTSQTGFGRSQGHSRRRSSGSDSSTRRVLADLDWWRVTDTQLEIEPAQDAEDEEQDPEIEESTQETQSAASEYEMHAHSDVEPTSSATWTIRDVVEVSLQPL